MSIRLSRFATIELCTGWFGNYSRIMRFRTASKTGTFLVALSCCGFGQTTEIRGLPPRSTPADYQAQAKAGNVTLAAEFARHAVPTAQGVFNTEDYVVVEAAVFGAADTRLTISADDVSIRISGKKTPLPSQPYGLILKSLKDPDWAPPETGEPKSKSKGGITGGGGGGGGNDPPPLPPQMPLELQRAMAQKVQKAVLPEGAHALPVAGLLFFPYRGKTDSIRSLELIYSGPAGKATLALQP